MVLQGLDGGSRGLQPGVRFLKVGGEGGDGRVELGGRVSPALLQPRQPPRQPEVGGRALRIPVSDVGVQLRKVRARRALRGHNPLAQEEHRRRQLGLERGLGSRDARRERLLRRPRVRALLGEDGSRVGGALGRDARVRRLQLCAVSFDARDHPRHPLLHLGAVRGLVGGQRAAYHRVLLLLLVHCPREARERLLAVVRLLERRGRELLDRGSDGGERVRDPPLDVTRLARHVLRDCILQPREAGRDLRGPRGLVRPLHCPQLLFEGVARGLGASQIPPHRRLLRKRLGRLPSLTRLGRAHLPLLRLVVLRLHPRQEYELGRERGVRLLALTLHAAELRGDVGEFGGEARGGPGLLRCHAPEQRRVERHQPILDGGPGAEDVVVARRAHARGLRRDLRLHRERRRVDRVRG
mmetsp:Transcript_62954/g.150109  ORF Transcript_62954/g.150109 Transcript_62954/m.150109 type:complete len:411 (+) Transcript_62954:2853-4085(+)